MDQTFQMRGFRRKSDLNITSIQIAPPLLSEITRFIRMVNFRVNISGVSAGGTAGGPPPRFGL